MMIGKTIIALREGKQWSLSELARQSGVPKSVLSKIENGQTSNPGIDTVHAIAMALDVSAGALLDSEMIRLPIALVIAHKRVQEAPSMAMVLAALIAQDEAIDAILRGET